MLSEKALRNKLLLAMSEVHSGNGAEGNAILDAILTALVEEGYVIVPREPTEAMERAGVRLRAILDNSGFKNTAEIYRAMIAARDA